MENKLHFSPIAEEDFLSKMQNEVVPFLEKYKETGKLKTDGAKIYYETYRNPQEKAAIVISHGFCEFTTKFIEVIYYFFQEGYSVFISDHRGFGHSSRLCEELMKVMVSDYEDYVEDLYQFILQVVQKQSSSGKLILYAHSMGGTIGALFMEKYQKVFQCAVLTAPMFQMRLGNVPDRLAHLVIGIMTRTGQGARYAPGEHPFTGEVAFAESCCLSKARYMRIYQERMIDPYRQTYGATYSWVAASLAAIKRLQKNARLVQTPILLFQAEKDTTVKPGGQRRFAANTQHTRLVEIAESKHEIYNATDAILKQYYPMIFQYLEEQLKECDSKK